MQQAKRFNPNNVVYNQLGFEFEEFRKQEHISIKSLSDDAKIGHHTYAAILHGIDFKFNYYLRLFWAFMVNSDQGSFFTFLQRFMKVAIEEICRVLTDSKKVFKQQIYELS